MSNLTLCENCERAIGHEGVKEGALCARCQRSTSEPKDDEKGEGQNNET